MRKFRIQSACRIAGLDRDRFNEAVAAGKYPCAPEVVRGSTRVFDEIDLIVLTIYRIYLFQHPVPLAGMLACKIHELLSQKPDEAEIVLFLLTNGAWKSTVGSTMGPHKRKRDGMAVLETRYVNVDNIREYVRREAREEARTLGAEDE